MIWTGEAEADAGRDPAPCCPPLAAPVDTWGVTDEGREATCLALGCPEDGAGAGRDPDTVVLGCEGDCTSVSGLSTGAPQ